MKAMVVIGMNFGDEGKGHITNFLSNNETLNIRFNGGAQAAHAVFLSNGHRHIFKHFGSGSLSGARTMLGSHFIVNPLFFGAEWTSLAGKVPMREVFIDPRCRITTIYDMLINEFSCYYRKKNDTTGCGINETVERSQFRQLKISMRDLIDKDISDIAPIIEKIRSEYLPWRLKKLSLPLHLFDDYRKLRISNFRETEEAFLNALRGMLKCIVVWPEDNLIDRYLAKSKSRQLVFEGGQGFRLDQNRTELMPYLTRSNTGLQNVFDCLSTVKTALELDVYLVTRTYLTRHGDGPLWNEVRLPYNNVEDHTNVENSYQGKLRYGYLNKSWYDDAIDEIRQYIKDHQPGCVKKVNIYTAFTHLDQLDNDEIIYSINGSKDFIVGNINDFSNVKILSSGREETDCKFVG